MPSPTGQNRPEAMRPLELRRQARVVAWLAEYLADEVCTDRNEALEAIGTLAEWCEGDPELLAHACNEAVRETRDGPSAMVENNRHAIQLLELVRSTS